MGWSASIRVVNREGDPVYGAVVSLYYWSSMDWEYTDCDGWAEFTDSSIDLMSVPIRVLTIDSVDVATDISLTSGQTVSFTL